MADKALILIVEDIVLNSHIIEWSINKRYDTICVQSGEECLALIEGGTIPDLILLDITMPGIGGHETCRRLKANEKTSDIPVIFITAASEHEDETFGFELGAVDYITKPVKPAILCARVNTHITMKQQRDQLNHLAFHDQLTGLSNRHYFLSAAKYKVDQALRDESKLWLLMIDIDKFKNINDTHGHAIGDLILQEVATSLNQANRSNDLVSRFGGEEFVIIFDSCKKEDALTKAEKLRSNIEKLKPDDIFVSISIGMACLSSEYDNIEKLLKSADDALYEAKRNGRNRIELGIMSDK